MLQERTNDMPHASLKRCTSDEETFESEQALIVIRQLARERSLSGREYEVLAATARGQTTKQIGYGLGISANTVAYYWAQIFRKLACRSQIEVMALLFRRATTAPIGPCVSINPPTTFASAGRDTR